MDLTKPYKPEKLICRTSNGTPVRSKNEVIIFDLLTDKLGFNVEYEKPLIGSKTNTYRLPDFTITHSDRVYYWEHLGMLDKTEYKADWDIKLEWYKVNGYYDNLIISEDIVSSKIIYADEILKLAKEKILDNIGYIETLHKKESDMNIQQICWLCSSYQVKSEMHRTTIYFPKGLFSHKKYILGNVSYDMKTQVTLIPNLTKAARVVSVDNRESGCKGSGIYNRKDKITFDIDMDTHAALCGEDGYNRLMSIEASLAVDDNGVIYITLPSIETRSVMLRKESITRTASKDIVNDTVEVITNHIEKSEIDNLIVHPTKIEYVNQSDQAYIFMKAEVERLDNEIANRQKRHDNEIAKLQRQRDAAFDYVKTSERFTVGNGYNGGNGYATHSAIWIK